MKMFDDLDFEIGVIGIDGQEWWFAEHACKHLGLQVTACSSLYSDCLKNVTRDGAGVAGTDLMVNFSGLCELALTSSTPEAKRFQEWLSREYGK